MDHRRTGEIGTRGFEIGDWMVGPVVVWKARESFPLYVVTAAMFPAGMDLVDGREGIGFGFVLLDIVSEMAFRIHGSNKTVVDYTPGGYTMIRIHRPYFESKAHPNLFHTPEHGRFWLAFNIAIPPVPENPEDLISPLREHGPGWLTMVDLAL